MTTLLTRPLEGLEHVLQRIAVFFFSTSPLTAAVGSTRKMRDYFSPFTLAPLMGSLMPSNRNVQLFQSFQLFILHPGASKPLGIPSLLIKERAGASLGLSIQMYTSMTQGFVTSLSCNESQMSHYLKTSLKSGVGKRRARVAG